MHTEHSTVIDAPPSRVWRLITEVTDCVLREENAAFVRAAAA